MSEQLLISFEEWRPVKGYEGFYSVSNLGRVRRDKSPKKRTHGILKTKITRNGYVEVQLSANAVVRSVSVHRLVGFAFLEKPEGKNDINHKNGKRSDNRLDNIEWLSRQENIQHMFTVLGNHGPQGEAAGSAKLTMEIVKEIRRTYASGSCTQDMLAQRYGVLQNAISRIVNGKRWQHLDLPYECSELKRQDVRGEQHRCTTLTNEDVITIRQLYAAGGFSMKQLAKRYNMTISPIRQIIRRITWKHLVP